MMRVNHKTKSCECIIIHQDELLYIVSCTLQEILHIMKVKYKSKINPHINGSNFPCDFRRNNDLLITISRLYTPKLHINIIYIKFYQVQHYIHFNIPIYKKQEKLIHDFILYTRNFLHENGKQILHNGEYQSR